MRTFTLMMGLLMGSLTIHAQIFVDADATGANNGSSWMDAYPTLDAAIAAAPLNEQIWVAEGTYVPVDSFMGIVPMFALIRDLALYGGFAGTETLLSERDPALHPTILSGDVNGDDIMGDFQTNRSDNRNNILLADTGLTTATIIDGLTFRGGHAAGVPNPVGGAILCGGSPQIRNCTFTENYASLSGGAVLATLGTAADLILDSCIFTGNYANYGGGLSISGIPYPQGAPQVINCVFSQNEAEEFGGGIEIYNSEATLIGNSSIDNAAPNSVGGGVVIIQFQPGHVSMEACDFMENRAVSGGGIYFQGTSEFTTLEIAHSTFMENDASISGAGVLAFHTRSDGLVRVRGCEFTGNTSATRGGGLYYESEDVRDTLLVDSCSFAGNEANASGDGGGGLELFYDPDGGASVARITNATFTNNQAFLGAGMYVHQLSDDLDLRLNDCEFSGNQADFGGGIHFRTEAELGILSIDRCRFFDNQAAQFGAGLRIFHASGSGSTLSQITHSVFEENVTNGLGAGIGAACRGFNGVVEVDSCLFRDNQSEGGGAVFVNSEGPFSLVKLRHTDFTDNAGFQTGAVGVETLSGGELSTEVTQCNFFRNQASVGTGGLGIVAQQGSQSTQLTLSDCSFSENRLNEHAGPSYGAALVIATAVGDFDTQVERCTFRRNHNPNGAAAVSILDLASGSQDTGANITINNSAFTEHDSSLAVIWLTRESDPFASVAQVELNNLTIADNAVPALHAREDISLTLRNNILYSPAHPDVIIGDSSLISSGGGNLISDTSAQDFLTAADASAVDPMFTGLTPYPYQLQDSSPAITLGVAYAGFDSASTDLLGHARVQGSGLDAGAFESDFAIILSTHDIEGGGLLLYPNPVAHEAHISLDNGWQGKLMVSIFSASGQQVFQQLLSKQQQQENWTISFSSLPSGIYQLVISDGKRATHTSVRKR